MKKPANAKVFSDIMKNVPEKKGEQMGSISGKLIYLISNCFQNVFHDKVDVGLRATLPFALVYT